MAISRTQWWILFLSLAGLAASFPWWESWQRRWLGPVEEAWLEEQLLRRRFPAGAIRLADGDPTGVCHDWTFRDVASNGPLGPEQVDEVLRQQGYVAVPLPDVGDVVIYRDALGVAIHSGRVRAMGSDGLILVESKWGVLGRFLHEPELPGWSVRTEYYRRLEPYTESSEAMVVE